jgi:hypothetical protein
MAQLGKRAKLSKGGVYTCDPSHSVLFGFEFVRSADVAALVGQHLVAPSIPLPPRKMVRGCLPSRLLKLPI